MIKKIPRIAVKRKIFEDHFLTPANAIERTEIKNSIYDSTTRKATSFYIKKFIKTKSNEIHQKLIFY